MRGFRWISIIGIWVAGCGEFGIEIPSDTAAVSVLTVTPLTLNFKAEPGGDSPIKTFVLSSNGDEAVFVEDIYLIGQYAKRFHVDGFEPPFRITAEGSREIELGFDAPNSEGVYNAVLMIEPSGEESPKISRSIFGTSCWDRNQDKQCD